MHSPKHIAASTCLVALTALSAAAQAATQNTFTGAWAPTTANGFELATGGSGLFQVWVSPDGQTLVANINNDTDLSFASFFLQNYGWLQSPPVLLPQGQVSYDYSITYKTTGDGGVSTFDDFGNSGWVNSGETITGHYSTNYTGGYFGYFGVNIRGWDYTLGEVPAKAEIILSNFTAPVPEPAAWVLALAGLGLLALKRRQG